MLLGLLAQSGIHIPITAQLLFSLLAILLAGWLVFTLIIRYHWKNYSTGGVELFTMNFFYLLGSGVLIAGLLITGLLYVSSS